MKQIKSVIVVLTLFTLILSSCKKSTPNPQTSISLKFNGALQSSSSPVAVYDKSQNSILITGGFSSTSAVSLAINNLKVGTFNLSTGEASAFYSTGSNLQDSYVGTTGNIVITSLTSVTITGTFQFTGNDLSNVTGTITEGKFEARQVAQ